SASTQVRYSISTPRGFGCRGCGCCARLGNETQPLTQRRTARISSSKIVFAAIVFLQPVELGLPEQSAAPWRTPATDCCWNEVAMAWWRCEQVREGLGLPSTGTTRGLPSVMVFAQRSAGSAHRLGVEVRKPQVLDLA